MVSISLNGPYRGVDGCHVIIFVQGLSNLIKARGIKCVYKVVSLSCHLDKSEEEEDEQ
jgi:hypothetical protein